MWFFSEKVILVNKIGEKMKIIYLWGLIMALMINLNAQENKDNPFFEYFELPPFSKIKESHYKPAFLEGMRIQAEEIKAISENPEPPTFQNTIEAFEYSGEMLDRVSSVFYNLKSANTNQEMQDIAKELSPLQSRHRDDIYLNAKLFARIKKLFESSDNLNLNPEQKILLEKYYKDFVRSGAGLSDSDKEILRGINAELSMLTLKFNDNILNENAQFEMILDNESDLEGLPQSVIDASAVSASEKALNGKWRFTIDKPSMIPFLQYSSKRDLREKLYKGYINKGDNNNELDNKEIVKSIVNLRIKKAHLLGSNSHSEFILSENMSKNTEKVYELLDKLWEPALKVAKRERSELQSIIDSEGGDFKLDSWDWWYYAEKLRKEKYDLDESELRPYFKLDNVLKGVFGLAESLFGIKFNERRDIEVYHPDVRTFEVTEADGTFIGILYTDYFPRRGKGGGAWMNSFRDQQIKDGKNIYPIICNVGNFTKPTADVPSLLSLDEVETLFHEFGHGLHGLLSKTTYPKLSGTSVPRDFVELPSQIMENWVLEPEMLRLYAFHYQTGEVIPDSLIEKIKNSSLFNQGFNTVEYLAASYLDLAWHNLTESAPEDVNVFENKVLEGIGLIPEIISRYRSTYFNHIFSGGYSAGYYSYIWAEVLDADAFETFVETGLFNRKTGESLRQNILQKGGTEEPMKMFINFRGKEPSVEPLLRKRGLTENDKGNEI